MHEIPKKSISNSYYIILFRNNDEVHVSSCVTDKIMLFLYLKQQRQRVFWNPLMKSVAIASRPAKIAHTFVATLTVVCGGNRRTTRAGGVIIRNVVRILPLLGSLWLLLTFSLLLLWRWFFSIVLSLNFFFLEIAFFNISF